VVYGGVVSENGASDRRSRLVISFAVSAAALLVAAAHVAFPDLEIDAITLGLLVVAVIPWLSPILESIEAPGGWKLKFRELEQRIEEKGREVEALSTRLKEIEGLVVHGQATPELKDSLRGELASFDAYLQGLGLGPVGELPSIRIDEEFTNAFYDPGKNEVVLGRGTVENRYLLFRLYGMQVLGALQPAAMADPSDTGLGRGMADFVAASFIGEAAYRHTPEMRHLHNEGRLDEVGPSEDGSAWDPAYAAGEVWGGALWEFRRLIGAERAAPTIVSAWLHGEGRVEPFLEAALSQLAEAEQPIARDLFTRRALSPG
jgi:hypothetical protein